MKAHVISLLLLLGTLLQTTACRRDPVLAEVGNFRITASDAKRRDEVIRIYYPEENRAMGLDQLIQTYTYAQILNNHGVSILDEILQKESDRINTTTLMPEMLDRIKRIFGDDQAAYLRLYILPVYVERVIYYEFFLRDSKIQAESFKQAQDLLFQVKPNPKNLCSLAKKISLSCFKIKATLARGLEYGEVPGDFSDKPQPTPPTRFPISDKIEAKRQVEASEEGRYWIKQIAAPLKPGMLHPEVLDRGEYWLVTRYVGVKSVEKESFQFEGVSIPKAPYGEWLALERAKVPVKRY